MTPTFADEGFIVLVRVPVRGGPDERASYAVGLATKEECISKVRSMYPDDPKAEMTASPLTPSVLNSLRLLVGEARPYP